MAAINDGERTWKKKVDRACNRDNGQWEVWQGPGRKGAKEGQGHRRAKIKRGRKWKRL